MAKGKTLEQFRVAHDRKLNLRTRVNAALKLLGESWEYEGDFAKKASLSMSDWGLIRDDYAEHIVLVKASHGRGSNGFSRRVVAGTPTFAKKLKESISG